MRLMMVSRSESCAKTVWVIRKTIQGRVSLFFIPHITFIMLCSTTSSHLTRSISGAAPREVLGC